MLTYLAATWLGLNAGIATALAAAYRRHNRHLTDLAHDFDRHADEALAVAAWDDARAFHAQACSEHSGCLTRHHNPYRVTPAEPRCNPVGGVHAEWCPDRPMPPVVGSGQPAGKSEGLDDAGPVPCCSSPRHQTRVIPPAEGEQP